MTVIYLEEGEQLAIYPIGAEDYIVIENKKSNINVIETYVQKKKEFGL